jgi:hypothetical protein
MASDCQNKDDENQTQIIMWLTLNGIIIIYSFCCYLYIRRFRKQEILSEVNFYLYLEKYY